MMQPNCLDIIRAWIYAPDGASQSGKTSRERAQSLIDNLADGGFMIVPHKLANPRPVLSGYYFGRAKRRATSSQRCSCRFAARLRYDVLCYTRKLAHLQFILNAIKVANRRRVARAFLRRQESEP